MSGQITIPHDAISPIPMPQSTFAAPEALVEAPTATPGQDDQSRSNRSIRSNISETHEYNHRYRGGHLWQISQDKPVHLVDWFRYPPNSETHYQARKQEIQERERLFSCPEYQSRGFDAGFVEAQVDQYSKHTKLFLNDVKAGRAQAEPLEQEFVARRTEWQEAIDAFCQEHRPPTVWQPNVFVRVQIERLMTLEDAMVAAKDELDACIKRGKDHVINMLEWDFDPEGQKRKEKAKNLKVQREMVGYKEMMAEMTRMDLVRKRPVDIGATQEDVKFVEHYVEGWKLIKGLPVSRAARERFEAEREAAEQKQKQMAMVETEREAAEHKKKKQKEREVVNPRSARRRPRAKERPEGVVPMWFLVLEARGVIGKPNVSTCDAVQRYSDFHTWLFDDGQHDEIFVQGERRKRWYFGGREPGNK